MASDFNLADCLVYRTSQLCWDCANAYGGCSWTAQDPQTHKIRFEPVPGWDATPTRKSGENREMTSYAIRACPEFVREVRDG